ncbi:MAG: type II toxin-antitoxin system RelE/ParE family toxin [Geminicoccaceae bacterium]
MQTYEIEEYTDGDGKSPFAEWLAGLKDRRAQARILTRLDRASLGNLGDWKMLAGTDGVAELRDPYGPGYRVYFAIIGKRIILLLAGSTKQDQARAIQRAATCLEDYNRRTQT